MSIFRMIADECMKTVFKYAQDSDWKASSYENGNCVVSYKKSHDWEGYVYRSEFIIDVSPKAASQLLSDKIKHVKWNSNAKEIHTIESLDKDMEIRHIVSPGYLMGLVAARDFCNICGVTKIQQTGIYFAYYVSVDCRKCPPSKKYVRAHTYPSGTILYPIEGEPNKSRVVSITQFDAKVQPRSLAETLYPSLMALYSSCMKRGAQKLLE